MGIFGKGKYLYAPGTPPGDLPTAQTHFALPRNARQAQEWAREAGHPVAARVTGPDGTDYWAPGDFDEFMGYRAQLDAEDHDALRREWEGEAGL